MTLSKMITFTITAISLAQAVSLRLDIKRGGTDPIVQLRMHELIELISQKRDLGMRTAVIRVSTIFNFYSIFGFQMPRRPSG